MRIRKLVETLWVAEAMLVALALFFVFVGGAVTKSSTFMLGLGGAAVLFALHLAHRHFLREELSLAPDGRRDRERRGF